MAVIIRNSKTFNFIVQIFVILIIAHLTITTYSFSNTTIQIIGIILVTILFVNFTILKKKYFEFIIMMFACSHFITFMPGAGGLFNIISFFLLFFFFSKFNKNSNFNSNKTLILLLGILIFFSVLGWGFKSPVPNDQLILGIISFFGYILMVFFSSKYEITKSRLKLFLDATCIFSIYNLLVSLNTLFKIVVINSPLIITSMFRVGLSDHLFQGGVFSSSEISGEYGLLSFILLLPFFLVTNRKYFININTNKFLVLGGIIASLLNALLSFSKAIFVLTIIASILGLLFQYFLNLKSAFRPIKVIKISLYIIAILLLLKPIIPFDFIFQRFNDSPELVDNFLAHPLTGEGTSRETGYTTGLNRIKSNNWLIGYGWSVGSGNRLAWFGSLTGLAEQRMDHHNIYYSLIPIFGWIGTLAIVLIILNTIYRLFFSVLSIKRTSHRLLPLAIGLMFLLIFFLVDEWKINATRNPNYFMMLWIWIGISNSVVKTIKKDIIRKKKYYT